MHMTPSKHGTSHVTQTLPGEHDLDREDKGNVNTLNYVQ